ncbi:MAG: SDR family oxidoreductase [Gammaproteobacteria bacterium]
MASKSRLLLVTGASSGIGNTLCQHLLEEGHEIVALARDFRKSEISDEHFYPVELDLSDLDALPHHLEPLKTAYSSIDGIICCAGRGQFGSLEEFSYQQIRELLNLNFISQAFVTRAFLPELKRKKRGDVIFIGSEAALAGSRKGAIYCASKFALRGLAQALRDECARNHVRVTIINPGMVKTGFFDELDFQPGEDDANFIEAEDIANAISMVLSARGETVFDEINLSPLKKVVQKK